MPSFSFSGFNALMYAFPFFYLVIAIVHIGFAVGVASDISRHRTEGRAPFAMGTFIWFLATLIGGIFVAAIYWVITYSMLNPRIAARVWKSGPSFGAE